MIEPSRSPAARLPLEGGHHPADLRLRGRLARARHRHHRTGRRRPRPDLLRARPRHPDPRLRDGCRRRRPDGRRPGAARRARHPQPRGGPDPLRRARRAARNVSPAAPDGEVQALLAEAYQQPIREDLIARRLDELHAAGSKAAVAATPGAARRFGAFCAEHGADLFLVQSQVSSARHLATEYDPLSLDEFTRYMPIPVAVGNTTNAEAAYALMEQGAAAVFVGVGPGAACTTREVLGIGVPQVTAISDVAAARDAYSRRDRAVRPGRRRRRDAPWRRAGQGDRRRRGRADDRFAARPRRGGARPRHELGDGRSVADPSRAGRGSRSGRSGRWSGSCSGRPT